jgi:hypothetical protein
VGDAVTGPVFSEAAADVRVRELPLAHLSLELGHLYFEDFAAGAAGLRAYFREVAGWAGAVRSLHEEALARGRPRISTCFLLDDYSGPPSSPREVLPVLLDAAGRAGLRIDYLARESACVRADGLELASLVEERIVPDPAPGTNGSRPPLPEIGWLCNGKRSPSAPAGEAMRAKGGWQPPAENGTTRHSVFVDVELWSGTGDARRWSCAYLAAVWQLLRLGALRYRGEPVVVPRPRPEGDLPDEWDQLPAVTRLAEAAPPFAAYRSVSVLPRGFITTEQAVRTILAQVSLDGDVVRQTVARAAAEGIDLPLDIADRTDYVLAGDPPAVSRQGSRSDRTAGPTPTVPRSAATGP